MLLVLAAAGCLNERDRLDVPRLTLVLDNTTVAPGGMVRGSAIAVDGTGIIFLQVTVTTADSAAAHRLNRISADSVRLDFALPISSLADGDEVVSVTAIARDDQDFEVTATETAVVRIPPPAP
jgi:hypothetical protein